MADTTLPGVLPPADIHANRPAANAVGGGALYSCTTHGLIYQSDGVSTWTTWATLGTAGAYAPGGTDVAVTDGGTGASTAATARSNLGALADTDAITYLDGTVAAAPGTPAAGKLRVYAKTGKVLAVKDDAGLETVLGAGIADQGAFTYLDATEAAAPATPAAGKVRLYAKADGGVYSKDDAGLERGPFDAAGAGAGPLLYIDSLSLHASGDEFADTSLTGWTLGGALTLADVSAVTTEPYDATCLDIIFGAQSDYMYKAIGGVVEITLTTHGYTNSTPNSLAAMGGMIGLFFSDDAGNGTAFTPYNDYNAYMWALTAYAYSGGGGNFPAAWTPSADDYAASNDPLVFKLGFSGSTVTGSMSRSGGLRYKTATRTDSTTFTRMGIIRAYSGGGTNPTLRVGRFNCA